MATRPTSRDAGFTLVELLLVVAVSGIVVPAIAAATVVGLRTTDATNETLSASHDEQLVSAYLPSDVQSAASVSTGSTTCGTGGTPVLAVSWTEHTAPGEELAHSVTYAAVGTGSAARLVRRVCTGGSLVAGIPVVHGLDTAVATCTPSCAAPRTVALTVTGRSGHRFTVSGLRRSA